MPSMRCCEHCRTTPGSYCGDYPNSHAGPCPKCPTGKELRDAALVRVEANADTEWKNAARQAVIFCAAWGVGFTTDDVWAVIPTFTESTTHEPRAMGAIMQRLAKEGRIRKTDTYRNTVRPEAHHRPIPVWHPTRTPMPATVHSGGGQ